MKISHYYGIYCQGKNKKELEMAINLITLPMIFKAIISYLKNAYKAKKQTQVLLKTNNWQKELSFVDFLRYFKFV